MFALAFSSLNTVQKQLESNFYIMHSKTEDSEMVKQT